MAAPTDNHSATATAATATAAASPDAGARASAGGPRTPTFLFTDVEGSTRLWELQPEAMRSALAHHDRVARDAVLAHRGAIVKTTGDGLHAVFDDALDAVRAAHALQHALQCGTPAGGLQLAVRAGVHGGPCEQRSGDYFGPVLNRAARIMSAAHGGQTLVSAHVAEQLAGRLDSGCTLRALGSVRLRDLSTPEVVHQLVHADLRVEFPPLRSLEATPNNLAQQLDSFVGRDAVLAETADALARTRLLTLFGMGGLGKSRLSVQLGADVLEQFPDGVWLVELAPLADARLVPQALAGVLGVQEQPGQALAETLELHVRERRLLVILDNCEHVVHAAAELAKRLLQAGAGVKVLATSRDVLQLAGEVVYPVPPLDPADAVQLFTDRAGAANARFRLDADNAPAVSEICRRLDGIPLALELAAARTRALSPSAIAARLADRFKLLVTGDQTVLPRQRTLRALIDWSWDLLSGPERALLRRLAVFSGGWTLEAAETVCVDGADMPSADVPSADVPSADMPSAASARRAVHEPAREPEQPMAADDVLDLLARLVEKSLAVHEATTDRYRMLETVRAYALERLAEAHEEPTLRARHARWCVALADKHAQGVFGAHRQQALARIDAERENLVRASGWCARSPVGAEDGLKLTYMLLPYWRTRGLPGLGHGLAIDALANPAAPTAGEARCRALCAGGHLAYFTGQVVQARDLLEASYALARTLDDPARIQAALQPLGMVYRALGDERARGVYEAAIEHAERLGMKRPLAVALNSLAQWHRSSGRLTEAEALYRRVVGLARELQDDVSVAIARLNEAMLAISRNDCDAGRHALREVRELARRSGVQPVEQSLIEVCAGLASACGAHADALALFDCAEAQARASGSRRDDADDAFLQPLVAQSRAAIGAAMGVTPGATAATAAAQGAASDIDRDAADCRAACGRIIDRLLD